MGTDVGMVNHVFLFIIINWDGAPIPLGVGALCKLRTLRIGSGGTVDQAKEGNKPIQNQSE